MAQFKAALLAGKQTTGNTLASTMLSIPVTKFSHSPMTDELIPDEDRNSQERNFVSVLGEQWEEFTAEGYIYHDTFGAWLYSLFTGSPTNSTVETTAKQSIFKAADAPADLSLQFMNGVQAFQVLDACVDELTISYGGKEAFTYSVKGFGRLESKISAPTPSFSTARPLNSWMGAVTLGGSAYPRIKSAKFGWKRNREGFWAGGGKDPNRFLLGKRAATLDAILDMTTATDYDAALAGTTQNLVWTFADVATIVGAVTNPALILNGPDVRYKTREIDYSGKTPLLHVTGDNFYNAAAAASFWPTLITSTTY